MLKTKLAYMALGAVIAPVGYFIALSLLFAGCLSAKQTQTENKEGGYYQDIMERNRSKRYQALIDLGKESEKKAPDTAIEHYNDAIELYPNHPTAWYGRGLAKSELKQYELAIKDYDKAIEADWPYSISKYKPRVYCSRAAARLELLPLIDKIKDKETYSEAVTNIIADLLYALYAQSFTEETDIVKRVIELEKKLGQITNNDE